MNTASLIVMQVMLPLQTVGGMLTNLQTWLIGITVAAATLSFLILGVKAVFLAVTKNFSIGQLFSGVGAIIIGLFFLAGATGLVTAIMAVVKAVVG